jgi:hypothetical protein
MRLDARLESAATAMSIEPIVHPVAEFYAQWQLDIRSMETVDLVV